MFGFSVSEDGDLLITYAGDEAPNFYINENGELCFDA